MGFEVHASCDLGKRQRAREPLRQQTAACETRQAARMNSDWHEQQTSEAPYSPCWEGRWGWDMIALVKLATEKIGDLWGALLPGGIVNITVKMS